MNIAIIGAGYVGMANAVFFASQNNVTINDIDKDKIDKINRGICPVKDSFAEKEMKNDKVNIYATLNLSSAIKDSEIVFICLPTDYDMNKHKLDVVGIEKCIGDVLKSGYRKDIVIRSTVPIGFTEYIKQKFIYNRIFFVPEFLREGQGVKDCKNPNRIVIGGDVKNNKKIENIFRKGVNNKKVPFILVTSGEAEAIKLFSNAYLALRIAFFNELDSFSEMRKLDTKSVIKGLGYDYRIGSYYNNPSFGFGGYCLPKDTKQLVYEIGNMESAIFPAIIESNKMRKGYIVNRVLKMDVFNIGIYRLNMKKNSDNIKESAILDIIDKLIDKGKNVIVYEPYISIPECIRKKIILENNIEMFKQKSEVILANRYNDQLSDVSNKIYSRDIYQGDTI